MADYKTFFKRENFLASMKAAKERKMKWEREVQQKWDELNKELEHPEANVALIIPKNHPAFDDILNLFDTEISMFNREKDS